MKIIHPTSLRSTIRPQCIALMDDQNNYLLNGNWRIDWPGIYEVAGDVLNYARTKDFESISINGPLLKDFIVTVRLTRKIALHGRFTIQLYKNDII